MMATVRAPGSRLTARPSLTQADASVMASRRRQVSGQENTPPLHVQEAFDNEKIIDQYQQPRRDVSNSDSLNESGKRVSSLVHLDLPQVQNEEGLGFGLEQEFDRVVKAQKRGYLMRQNTKVVVASNRSEDDVEPPPPQPTSFQPPPLQPTSRKISQQAWVTEPWNGKSRRRSVRTAGETNPRTKGTNGVAPPLPGHSSAVDDGLGAVNEIETGEGEAADFDEHAERGCLFVKVVGVKDLALPFPSEEQNSFALTLDNGLHCVTTSWLQLRRDAPIDQEFELVVLDDLEFQLTLQMKLEQPKPAVVAEAPAQTPPSPIKKQGAFSRLFGSPRKNREAQALRPTSPVKQQPATMYDLVQGIVGQDGSFARAYVALSEHEKEAFGRPYTVDITCFNEWAMEEVPLTMGSARSKKSVNTLQRRVPYQIGKLELLLLYIPKPKGTKDEDMPKSMNSAIRELRDAEVKSASVFEGHLSQQGGDCPYWRRRLFKLVGPKLTAYHESTNQPRATINLAKATRLVDDKSALTKKETTAKGGGRRKSAFAEEEDGYMFVEEGFRIRFGNGEVIDFYADSAAAKAEWMKALSEVVGKASSSSQSKPWVDAIIKRERSLAVKEGRNPRKPGRPEASPKKSSQDHPVQEQMSPKAVTKQRQEPISPAPVTKHGQESMSPSLATRHQDAIPPTVAAAAAEAGNPTQSPTGARSSDNRNSNIPIPSSHNRSQSQSPVKDLNSRYMPQQEARRQQPPTPHHRHARTDSNYQQQPHLQQPRQQSPLPPSNSGPSPGPQVPGPRSQPAPPPTSSPTKAKTSRETRYQKARSMIGGMNWR